MGRSESSQVASIAERGQSDIVVEGRREDLQTARACDGHVALTGFQGSGAGSSALCLLALLLCAAGPLEAAWSTPRRIGSNDGDFTQPEIAVEGRTVHVAYRPGGFGVSYLRSEDCGDTWFEPISVPSTFGSGLSMAISEAVVHIVWGEFASLLGFADSRQIFHVQSWDGGQTWSRKQRISNATQWNGTPSLVALGYDLWVAWSRGEIVSSRFRPTSIVVARSSSGGQRWRRRLVSRDAPGAFSPRIALDRSSAPEKRRLHLVWEREVAGADPRLFRELMHQETRDAGKSWSEPVRLNETIGLGASALVAMRGAVHVVWQVLPGFPRTRSDVFYRRKVRNKPWGHEPALNATGFAARGKLAGSDRTLWAAWVNSQISTAGGISVRRSRNGGKRWNRQQLLSTTGGLPAIAVPTDPVGECAGTAHVVYHGRAIENGVTRYGLVYQRHPKKLH